MKALLAVILLFSAPAIAAPQCVVYYNGVCFKSQEQYDKYMGWGPELKKLEEEANR